MMRPKGKQSKQTENQLMMRKKVKDCKPTKNSLPRKYAMT